MGNFLFGFVLPLLLLTASLLDWNLISLVDLLAFLILQCTAPKRGFCSQGQTVVALVVVIFSVFAILAEVVFHVVWLIEGEEWSIANTWWATLIGFVRNKPWIPTNSVLYFLALQLTAALIALYELYMIGWGHISWQVSNWRRIPSIASLGSPLRVACCLLLPAIQVVVGISYPSWVSLPFFICSCVGLVSWSLTSNFLGLFWWWRPLLLYAALNIILLYIYQLPIHFPTIINTIASFIGLYKASAKSEWPEICSGLSLLIFYFMLSCVKCDLEEMESIMSMRENSLTEQLLPLKHSFFIRESRSGVRHTNVLLKGAIFRNFSINFFTYGFPVSLLALSFWSFNFASICAFGLLAYVGYVLYASPSLFHLHQLNGLLLVFILLWAASTYIFNVAFTFLNKKLKQDMEIWETIGLWHYPIPGFFLLAQFCLGFLVAMGNLVNNSVFQYLSDEDEQSSNRDTAAEEKEETKVLIVATIAWGLRKSSRAITLLMIFLLAMKPGFIHAVYMIFFFIYLLSHSVSRGIRQILILLCEAHFALLYILQLNLISRALEHKGSLIMTFLSQLGLLYHASGWDFLKIAALMIFCAVQNHGFKILSSFSAIVQHTPHPPIGFSILKAGLNKSVLLYVYASSTARNNQFQDLSHEKWIATYLGAVSQKFLSTYRSYGTYIAFLTILVTVYLVIPNYISFGYLFFLLFWIIGRQLVEKTRRRLWFPLKVYATLVFIFAYSLSIFPSFERWLSRFIDLYTELGYNPDAPLLENVWESLAVLIVMQLYSYERRQSRYYESSEGCNQFENGCLGFIRRVLIWHSEKIVSFAVFYASSSPISAFGFIYLFALVGFAFLPKVSRIPSKFYLVYTGLLVTSEYLFQMWGSEAHMFPGQKHSYLSHLLGFQVFGAGFWGLEAGLRGKILVIVTCTLQYNVFHWLEKMPASLKNTGKWEEPCHLFVSKEKSHTGSSKCTEDTNPTLDSSLLSIKQRGVVTNSCPAFGSDTFQGSGSTEAEEGSGSSTRRLSFSYFWGSTKESHRWNKKLVLALRKERFDMQVRTLRVYLKFWMENIFNLFGLEVNMIVLLLASFTVLNAISLCYVLCLVACVLLNRHVIRKLWPLFVFLFASILTVEYLAAWKNFMPWDPDASSQSKVRCHDCWSNSSIYFNYCTKCWLGLVVDDPQMLVSYYLVFIAASFKFRSDHLVDFSASDTYRQMMSQRSNASVWRELSYETKSHWTILDYLRLYAYCHLLDIVLLLILITGTLEYDILHLGYLGFALIFFRMRLDIMKKKNQIFKFLRMYNFALIVLSLAYQSPFLGDTNTEKCAKIDYIYEVVGFYKYDYGFRITSRSALVEIVIFMLVSLQSYIFCSREFDYVSRYLEAEQMDAMLHAQEKRAAWKTAQLQHIRKSEEKKRQRNLQVEKMKAEMLNLQSQLHSLNGGGNYCNTNASPNSESIQRRDLNSSPLMSRMPRIPEIQGDHREQEQNEAETVLEHLNRKPKNSSVENVNNYADSSSCEITELEERSASLSAFSDGKERDKSQTKENPLISAVQLIGDGVSQVQSLGNQAVTNIVSFLKIEHDDSDSNEYSSAEDGGFDETESHNNTDHCYENSERTSSLISNDVRAAPELTSPRIGKLFHYIWTKMRSNNDVVCYCCFILVFLWNFSLLSMVYLGALFLYALCVNPGPNYLFWVIMLICTEMNILLQYLYQIIIQHCGWSFQSPILWRLGFPAHKITASFVISTLPLFLVYLSTLLQSSITAKDGEWMSVREFRFYSRQILFQDEAHGHDGWKQRLKTLVSPFMNVLRIVRRAFSRYWKSLTHGSEAPPYFVQLSMEVDIWPEDTIQPERIESGVNKLLESVHNLNCKTTHNNSCHSASKVRVQSIERSPENSSVALAVFEVVYASPLEGCPKNEWYKSLTPAADVAAEICKAQREGPVEELGFPYEIISVIAGGKREVDLYAYIFCADLVTFFLVAMFYQSAIKNNSKFLDVYQLEDQFPKEFVFVLMILFFLIVLDRIIYLCSFATGKVIFYFFNLILFTYSVTIYAWYMELDKQRTGALALRAIYLTKAISLALQALQIRYGIPHKSTLYRQFLTTKVSQINYLGFRLYRALPFLYELRCVLDWSCTSTSLTMYDWLKIYSSGNPTNIANPIKDVSVQIDLKTLGGRLTLYQTTLCEKLSWENLLEAGFDLDPQGYLDTYNVKDIQLICCQADASTVWMVPSLVQAKFLQSLDRDMAIFFSWAFTRDRPKGKEVVKYEIPVEDPPKPAAVKEVLNGTSDHVRICDIYPRYFRVTGSGEVRHLEQAEQVNMVTGDLVMNNGSSKWWSFYDIDASDIEGCDGLKGPSAIIVSEETPQGILGETLSKFSIWSLYLTFVLAVGRFIRLQCSDLRMRIPYENLPSCDRLIAICEDIYAARAEGELEVEEVLYWTLVKIYRSPHMLLEYTKPD
ncbi:piezo-type mechanosensitive ion channel homolog isoform X2 [Amborella trichopoda]|uniref:piezo-type mechanosensitive ion channel homolog isoform X2 n=1 Tax=Amborella trichopoda TaxID=13333 RepID=UPI0009C016D8|nr:piezo-type mechanosensitive ion channel homolog isoform X2 [Amborella trichopoda]|eukprot:XP_020526921.1 piezo-type mechanosensitive ion channel homolog isoform X2 [Amborella trichopoda]